MISSVGGIPRDTLFREVHWQTWRVQALPLELDIREVQALLPMLVRSGSVGLIWPRMRHRMADYGALGLALEDAYQSQISHNHLVKLRIAEAVDRLENEGIYPIQVKGWSVSRRYPEYLVRPAGDIDLIVPAADYERAKEVCFAWQAETGEVTVDLHRDTPADDPALSDQAFSMSSVALDLHSDMNWEYSPSADLLGETSWITVEGRQIQVLRPEDELQMLIFHFLKHGGARVMRLVDIAVLLESRTDGFDWDRLMGDDPVRRNWVATGLGLAHLLLGARIDDTPVADAAQNLPSWLIPVASNQVVESQLALMPVMKDLLANPGDILGVFRRRWPDPITATIKWPTHFAHASPLPIQAAVYVRQVADYVVGRMMRQISQEFRTGA